jgi:hypothetical protein
MVTCSGCLDYMSVCISHYLLAFDNHDGHDPQAIRNCLSVLFISFVMMNIKDSDLRRILENAFR